MKKLYFLQGFVILFFIKNYCSDGKVPIFPGFYGPLEDRDENFIPDQNQSPVVKNEDEPECGRWSKQYASENFVKDRVQEIENRLNRKIVLICAFGIFCTAIILYTLKTNKNIQKHDSKRI